MDTILCNYLFALMITKYGLKTFLLSAGFSVLVIAISFFIQIVWIQFAVAFLGILFLLFNMNFFRDPERIAPGVSNAVISPADGKVVILKQIFEERFLKEKGIQISIFMSPLNVHVNRIPIDGTIDYLNYVKGDYLVAFHEKADLRNERTEIGIISNCGKILFTQVAGFIARRIVYKINNGDNVKAGDRFGMIKFGSRSDVIVPKGWRPVVKLGEKVKAGETILFEKIDE